MLNEFLKFHKFLEFNLNKNKLSAIINIPEIISKMDMCSLPNALETGNNSSKEI